MLDYVILNKRWPSDQWVRELPTDSARLLFLTLMSQPQIGYTGIYEYSLDSLTLTVKDDPFVPGLLNQFEQDGKIARDRSWMWVVNFTGHQGYNAKAFAGAVRECKSLLRKTSLAQRWLDYYTATNETGKIVQVDAKTDERADFAGTRIGRLPNRTEQNRTEQSAAIAPDASIFLQLAEELAAYAVTLASEGYPVETRDPERLAEGMLRSGLPLSVLQETVKFGMNDPYYRAKLGDHRTLLNGGMFKSIETARLVALDKASRVRQPWAGSQPVADVVYPSAAEVLASQRCPTPATDEQAVPL